MTGGWLFLSVVCCGLFLFGTWAVAARTSRLETGEGGNWKLPLLVAGAVLVRVALATVRGYAADIGTFSAWAAHAADGLASFYSPGYFADYPPGYIYVLWLVGKLRLLLGVDFATPPFLLLLKFPAILADAATVWFLYRLAQRHSWSGNAPAAVAALYAFNPAVIIDSAVWGQVDGVLTFFILLGVYLLERHPAGSAASFAAALLIKPQALIFAPLPILWFAGRFLRRERHAAADLLTFAGAAIVVFCLGILPFSVNQDPGWIIAKYGGTLASYPYATLNAFNLFALTGGNLAPVAQRFLFLPYGAWGTVFIVLIVLFAAWVALRGKELSRLWYTPLFLSASVFVLSVKMHERYLFPALALALGFFIVSRDRRGLILFAGFSVTQYLNAAVVLVLSYSKVYAVPRFDPLLLSVSLANVLLWLLMVRVGWRHRVSE